MKSYYKARPDEWCTLFKMLCLLLISIATTGCGIAQNRPFQDKTAQSDVIFNQAVEIIEDNYIDASGKNVKLDTSGCPDINTLLIQLDLTTTYVTPSTLAVIGNPLKATIGIEFEMKDGALYVKKAIKAGPGYRAGIKNGERILVINGISVEGISLNSISFMAQGNPGSDVEMKILDKDNQTKHVHMRRQVIDPGPAIIDRMLGEKLGYIRINRFSYGISAKVKSAVKELLKSDMQSLMLDLRGNDYGLIDEVAKTTELFLKRNTLIAHLSGNSEHDIKTGNWDPYTDISLTVLIDRGTSWGAEILAAAVKDDKRAILIGDTTSGKGSIFHTFRLKDGSLLRLRTHYASSPAGKAIEGQGVEPDIESAVSEIERDALYEKLNSYEDESNNTVLVDTQLDKAVNYISGEMKNKKQAAR